MNMRNRILAAGLLVGTVLVNSAHATADFDPTTATTQIATAASVAGPIVGGLVAIGAGLFLWRKVRSLASKAS